MKIKIPEVCRHGCMIQLDNEQFKKIINEFGAEE